MLLPRPAMRLAIAIGTVIVAIAAVVFAWGHWNTIYDDAFIYLRYVRNLHDGCGPTFTCGDAPVEGFTSPLYLAVLWAGTAFTAHGVWLTQVVCTALLVIAGGLAVWAAALLAFRDDAWWRAPTAALSTAVLLALDPYVLLNANIGMETALVAACISLVLLAQAARRPGLLVGAAIAVLLARPEGVLFIVALPLVPELRRVRYLAPAAAAVVVLTVARYAIYGDVLPNTYYAKSGGTWQHAVLGAAYIKDCLLDFPVCVLAVLAWRTRYVPAVALAWLAFFVRSGGDTFEYSRLWFPLVPALSALALAHLGRLAPVIALVAGLRAAIWHHIPDQGTSPRVIEWMNIGTWLHRHYPAGTLVATVPVGAIGYYANLPLLDLVGLTDRTIAHAGHSVPPELLTKSWIGHERNETSYVLARAPEVIVTTMSRNSPWTLAEARAGFWADWLLLQEIKAGKAPYHVLDIALAPDEHVLAFERN